MFIEVDEWKVEDVMEVVGKIVEFGCFLCFGCDWCIGRFVDGFLIVIFSDFVF